MGYSLFSCFFPIFISHSSRISMAGILEATRITLLVLFLLLQVLLRQHIHHSLYLLKVSFDSPSPKNFSMRCYRNSARKSNHKFYHFPSRKEC